MRCGDPSPALTKTNQRSQRGCLEKTQISDSERKVLEHAHRGIQMLTEYGPKLMWKKAFMD